MWTLLLRKACCPEGPFQDGADTNTASRKRVVRFYRRERALGGPPLTALFPGNVPVIFRIFPRDASRPDRGTPFAGRMAGGPEPDRPRTGEQAMSTDGMKAGAMSPMTISQRTDPMAMHGMVTSPHYLASQAGLDILRRGGNAVEAAIAAAAALTVVYPQMCTLGGDNFWLIYDAGSGNCTRPQRFGPRRREGDYRVLPLKGLTKIPSRGWLAANTVPGRGFRMGQRLRVQPGSHGRHPALEGSAGVRLGTCRGRRSRSSSLHRWSVINTDTGDRKRAGLQRFQAFSETFLRDGKPYSTGDVFRQPRLAATLKALQENGPDEFYRGSIAARICADMDAHGGLLTARRFRVTHG